MTLFFSLYNLEQEANNSSTKFIKLLRQKYQKDPFLRTKFNLSGSSYLLNPAPLFYAHNQIDINYLVQYVRLAGRRDYTLYKLHGSITLDLSFFPDIDLERIKHNPLIKIAKNHIYFKYEELTHGIKLFKDQR